MLGMVMERAGLLSSYDWASGRRQGRAEEDQRHAARSGGEEPIALRPSMISVGRAVVPSAGPRNARWA